MSAEHGAAKQSELEFVADKGLKWGATTYFLATAVVTSTFFPPVFYGMLTLAAGWGIEKFAKKLRTGNEPVAFPHALH